MSSFAAAPAPPAFDATIRTSPAAASAANAPDTTPLDANDRWWVYKCPSKGCKGLLHAAGYAAAPRQKP